MLKNDFSELGVGDWCFINGETYIGIRLGEGENERCILPIQNKAKPRELVGTYWDWDGNRDLPTLTPSILHWGNGNYEPPTWHGYLTKGVLVVV